MVQNNLIFLVDYDVTQTWIDQWSFIPIGNQTLNSFNSAATCWLSCQLSCNLSAWLPAAPLAHVCFVMSVASSELSCDQLVRLPVSSTVFAQLDTDLLDWLQSVSLGVMCQLSCCMWAQVQIVSSAAASYHLHFADSQANKVCIGAGLYSISVSSAATCQLSCQLSCNLGTQLSAQGAVVSSAALC